MSILFNKSGSAILDLSTYTIPLSTVSPSRPTTPCVVGGVFNYLKKLIATKKPLTLITTEASIVTPYETSTMYTLTYVKDNFMVFVYVNSSNEVWSYKKEVNSGGGGGGSTDIYNFVETTYDIEVVVTHQQWGDVITYECEVNTADFDPTKINVLRCRIYTGSYWYTMIFMLSPVSTGEYVSLRGNILNAYMSNVQGLVQGYYDVEAYVYFYSGKISLSFYRRLSPVANEIDWSQQEVHWDASLQGWLRELTDDENAKLDFAETCRITANVQLDSEIYNYGTIPVLYNRATGNGLTIYNVVNSLDNMTPIVTSGSYLFLCSHIGIWDETTQKTKQYILIEPYNVTKHTPA